MPCKVCTRYQPPSHRRYGGKCCNACAAFLQRTISKKRVYRCQKNEKCLKEPSMLGISCRKCRFDKCVEVGMITPEMLALQMASPATPSTSSSSSTSSKTTSTTTLSMSSQIPSSSSSSSSPSYAALLLSESSYYATSPSPSLSSSSATTTTSSSYDLPINQTWPSLPAVSSGSAAFNQTMDPFLREQQVTVYAQTIDSLLDTSKKYPGLLCKFFQNENQAVFNIAYQVYQNYPTTVTDKIHFLKLLLIKVPIFSDELPLLSFICICKLDFPQLPMDQQMALRNNQNQAMDKFDTKNLDISRTKKLLLIAEECINIFNAFSSSSF